MEVKEMKTQKLSFEIEEFKKLKTPPKEIFYRGDLKLLENRKIAIVGTRKPINYTKNQIIELSKKLSKIGITIVSGSAMGVDIIAQREAYPNTISIMPVGLDKIYPKVNEKLIQSIYDNSLALSEYSDGFSATKWSFVQRNRLVVALSDILIVAEADLKSGSLTSVKVAKELKKEIYVLPHRLNESLGTNELLKKNQAKAIFDIDDFVNSLADKIEIEQKSKDEVLEFCYKNPIYEEAFQKFGDKLFEYELEGKITIENNFVRVI